MCKTLSENLALRGAAFWKQAGSDLANYIDNCCRNLAEWNKNELFTVMGV